MSGKTKTGTLVLRVSQCTPPACLEQGTTVYPTRSLMTPWDRAEWTGQKCRVVRVWEERSPKIRTKTKFMELEKVKKS